VAEDETLLRALAVDILEDTGFRVIEAGNAIAALSVLETRPDVCLLFTDIGMPGLLDGLELARQVHERWPHVLLILTSGQREPRRAEIPDDGRFIVKPYRAEELVGQVHELLRH
jgi:two-component system, response regulator PdtaR